MVWFPMARYSYPSRNYREMINAISVKKELEAGTIQGVNKDVILFQVRSPANPELNDGLVPIRLGAGSLN